jgi:hypothetical protein
MKWSIEQLILASAPEVNSKHSKAFTDKTMQLIKARVSMQEPKRFSFSLWLRHIPKAAAFILAIVATLIVSGTVYAIYTLWPKPIIHTGEVTKNQYGRSQVIASMSHCSDAPSQSTYEVKKSSTLSVEEIPKVLQAKCEKEVIGKWAKDHGYISNSFLERRIEPQETKEGDVQESRDVSPVASKIVSLDDAHISLTGDEYNSPKKPLPIDKDTKYYINGNEARREDFQPGDAVIFIKWTRFQYKLHHTDVQPEPVLWGEEMASKVTHVIKMELPFEYYGPTKQNQLIERQPCVGNPEDSCLDGGGVGLYEKLDVHSERNGNKELMEKFQIRRFQASIQTYNGKQLTVKTSSGRIFTLNLPSDIIATYNAKRSATYNNTKIGVGDMLDITYIELGSERKTSLDATDIQVINYVTDFIYKSDPIKKY